MSNLSPPPQIWKIVRQPFLKLGVDPPKNLMTLSVTTGPDPVRTPSNQNARTFLGSRFYCIFVNKFWSYPLLGRGVGGGGIAHLRYKLLSESTAEVG